MSSPTQRSLLHMRELGYLTAIVEHWNAFAHIRQDLFGCIDVLALNTDVTVAIQTTTSENFAARVTKLKGIPTLGRMLAARWEVHVHGWRAPNKSNKRWTLRIYDMKLDRELDDGKDWEHNS